MIKIQADNRTISQGQKYTFLTNNYASGVSSFYVLNASDSAFATDALLLLENWGSEYAEIVTISTVNANTGLITLASTTKRAHSESAKVIVIPYNQIRFYHTTSTTFDTNTPLTGYVNLQTSDWLTSYDDEAYDSGYAWFTFYNSVTETASQPSNYIPYAGFGSNTTEDILNDFYSLLGNKELRLVTREDALSWMSEGYSKVRNKLNLSNSEFTVSSIQTLSITSGTNEYSLPTDFNDLVSLNYGLSTSDPLGGGDLDKGEIEYIPLRLVGTYTGSTPKYYIRGSYIGIIPTPTGDTTYHYWYKKKGSRLSSNTDEITLPDSGEYIVKDWMLYRAYLKFQNQNMATAYLKTFNDGLDNMIISSVKRDANLDSFSISSYANI